MKSMRALLFVGVLAIFVLAGCRPVTAPPERVATVSDVTRAEVLDLSQTNRVRWVSSVRLRFEGYLDGTAYVVPWGGGSTQELSGTINSEWGSDHFYTNYSIQYFPGTVKTGSLTIRCLLY